MLETTLQNDMQRTQAIRELQGLTQVIVTGAAAASNIAVAGIKATDVFVSALNLTDLTAITRAAVKAEAAAAAITAEIDTVFEAHTAGIAGNSITIEVVGDSVVRQKAEYGPNWPGDFDAVIEAVTAGTAGNSIDIIFIGDSGGGGGVTINRNNTTFTIHYESGVSTVGTVSTAIAALAGGDKLIQVKTAGTVATVLTAPGDNSGSINLAGGVAGGGVTISRTGTDFIIHYEAGTSDITALETAVTALAGGDNLFGVKTGGTGGTALTVDTVAPVALTGGLAASAAESPVCTSAGNVQFPTTDTSNKKLMITYYSVP